MKSKKNDEHSVIGSTVDGPRERKVGLEKESVRWWRMETIQITWHHWTAAF